ncbi:MAG: glutamine--fructose-6-phosphate transaminase (isomerizing), partial [Gammaproteobacteria bacterium]
LSDVSLSDAKLGPYRHYMQKEIHEQPRALGDTVDAVATCGFVPELFGEAAAQVLAKVNAVQILAAGTSYHAGLTARYWFEDIAGLPVAVDIASEYRYRHPVSNPGQLVVSVSQSGETMDTLEALKQAKALGHRKTLAICNVRESAIARASALVFYTRAGVEIGVASTKAFTTQLVALFALAVTLGRLRGRVSVAQASGLLQACRDAARHVQYVLNLEPQLRQWAGLLARSQHVLFLGRGIHYPIAMEGALKLKEISYIHAEAYPAGELKHGPLALVDGNMPVVVLAPNDALLEKVRSNIQEVKARGGRLFVIADLDSEVAEDVDTHILCTPRHVGALSPLVHVVPLQLLAYHAALQRGTDVDKPRNLAKSVTVE